MGYLLGLLTLPAIALVCVALWGAYRWLWRWWTSPVDLDEVTRDRRAHVTAIVASELCAARRMWHIKIPGGVMLAIRSGGVGHDKGYGWVLLDRRMQAFENGIRGAFDDLDEQPGGEA